jgi:hypothetical protein
VREVSTFWRTNVYFTKLRSKKQKLCAAPDS